LDEIDSKTGEAWPLATMLGPLEWNQKFAKPIVWLFAGSGGGDSIGFEATLKKMVRGPDFLNRVKHPFDVIPPLTSMDRAIIALSHIISERPDISEIERAAILYLAGSASGVGEVLDRARKALGKLEQGSYQLLLGHCVDLTQRNDDEFQLTYKAELDSLSRKKCGLLRIPTPRMGP